jgi:2-amino-4-hydroxy-6-hydroxymethyldihydropteridine diphosphokinase
MPAVHVGLGSNLGDRAAALSGAAAALAALPGCAPGRVSSVYETEPWGVHEQPAFLNMAMELVTTLPPQDLLDHCHDIERRLGRVRRERWEPRRIDLDLILWNGLVVTGPALTLPHPAFRERRFVLVPLAEIAPEALDPVTGRTVRELLEQCRDRSSVVRRAAPGRLTHDGRVHPAREDRG